MHEMSIVEALLEAVEKETRAYPEARVSVLRVRVGQLRQVVPAMLEFNFQAVVPGTPLAGARLEIESVPARARCRECQAEFAVEENWFECPTCHSANGQLLAGDEMTLVTIEMENVPASASIS